MANFNSVILEGNIIKLDDKEGLIQCSELEDGTGEVQTFKVLNHSQEKGEQTGWDFMKHWELPVKVRMVGKLVNDENGNTCVRVECTEVFMRNKYIGNKKEA